MKTMNLAKPTMQRIAVNRLSVDRRYQRDALRSRVKKIADNLDLDGLGIVTVSERSDGTHWLLDGQTRCAAMGSLGMGEWELECYVYSGLTLEQEAAITGYSTTHAERPLGMTSRRGWKRTTTSAWTFSALRMRLALR